MRLCFGGRLFAARLSAMAFNCCHAPNTPMVPTLIAATRGGTLMAVETTLQELPTAYAPKAIT